MRLRACRACGLCDVCDACPGRALYGFTSESHNTQNNLVLDKLVHIASSQIADRNNQPYYDPYIGEYH